MKSSHKFFSLIVLLLMVLSLSAFQMIERNTEPVIEKEPDPVIEINPLTGTPVANPDLLKLPPIFVPLARYPSAFRASLSWRLMSRYSLYPATPPFTFGTHASMNSIHLS